MRGYGGRWGIALGIAVLAAGDRAGAAAGPKTAVFNVTAVHSSTDGQVTITSKVWISPTQARAEINHPLQGKQTVLVTGGYWYQLDPTRKLGVRAPLPREMVKSSDNFSVLVAKFAFDATNPLKVSKKVRTETVSGYPCDVFNATEAKGGDSRNITVWVPQKMDPNFPIKAVIEDKSKLEKPGATLNQSYSVSITLSNIQLRGPIPASTFNVPTGYKIKTAPAPGAPGSEAPSARKRHK